MKLAVHKNVQTMTRIKWEQKIIYSVNDIKSLLKHIKNVMHLNIVITLHFS